MGVVYRPDMRGIYTGIVLAPPPDYKKKIVNPACDQPLEETFTPEQVRRRIAFYGELNALRLRLPAGSPFVSLRCALHGWEKTTTVRVYMRETIVKIASQLFSSDYSLSVDNVYEVDGGGSPDKDHGHVVLSVRARASEIDALLCYVKPGASYYVYDGERSKYVPGDTAASEFIVTKPEDSLHPDRFWRRSQSFISWMEEA